MTAPAHITAAAQHTPGPWAVNPFCAQVDGGGLDEDGEPLPIARLLWPTSFRGEPETFANARLIAAAPELLNASKALRSLLTLIADGFWDDCPYPDAHKRKIAELFAVIDRATGAA